MRVTVKRRSYIKGILSLLFALVTFCAMILTGANAKAQASEVSPRFNLDFTRAEQESGWTFQNVKYNSAMHYLEFNGTDSFVYYNGSVGTDFDTSATFVLGFYAKTLSEEAPGKQCAFLMNSGYYGENFAIQVNRSAIEVLANNESAPIVSFDVLTNTTKFFMLTGYYMHSYAWGGYNFNFELTYVNSDNELVTESRTTIKDFSLDFENNYSLTIGAQSNHGSDDVQHLKTNVRIVKLYDQVVTDLNVKDLYKRYSRACASDTPVIEIGENGNWYIDGVDTGATSKGADGIDGVDGADGIDGINGIDGVNGINGKDGINGNDGRDGKDGADGQTPTISISEDGFWVINDVKTEMRAVPEVKEETAVEEEKTLLKEKLNISETWLLVIMAIAITLTVLSVVLGIFAERNSVKGVAGVMTVLFVAVFTLAILIYFAVL